MSGSSSDDQSKLATAKAVITAVGSIAATAVVVRGVANEFIPSELYYYLLSGVRSFFNRFSKDFTLVVHEHEGLGKNEVYDAAEIYLGPKISPYTRRLKISRPEKTKHFNVAMEPGEEVVDLFQGEKFKWVWVCTHNEGNNSLDGHRSAVKFEVRSFELTFHKKNTELAMGSYLPHILNVVEKIKQQKKAIQIFTVTDERWYDLSETWVPMLFDHPATFDTLAMDPDQKDMILKDLDRFIKRKEYYRKVGKAWKRGYLLYGPPGTGKSSLIAAMANYLNFDIYDLELSEVKKNSDLKRLLIATANKSILVVEDIDCAIELQKNLTKRTSSSTNSETEDHDPEKSRVTLSGFLNFVDGLWSTCGSERIIIFTTNHVEKLDPALLRPGRMDVHINMCHCTPRGFKVLAQNYLGIHDHPRLQEIMDSIQNVNVTPAEVAEQLLKDDDHDTVLRDLVDFISQKSHDANKDNNDANSDSGVAHRRKMNSIE